MLDKAYATSPGAAVYIPSGIYDLDFPLFVQTELHRTLEVYGDGMSATHLRSLGPIFMAGVKKVTPPVSDNALVDVSGFFDGTTGTRYGLNTSKFIVMDVFGPPYQMGAYMSEHRQLTIDFAVDASAVVTKSSGMMLGGPLCGYYGGTEDYWGNEEVRTWGIGLINSGSGWYVQFEMRPDDNPPYADKATRYTLNSPTFPTSVTKFKISVQVDLDGHGGSSGPVVLMWVNGTQVALSGTQPPVGSVFMDNVVDRFRMTPATVPGEFVICGLKATAALRYVAGSTGSVQQAGDGSTITDAWMFFNTQNLQVDHFSFDFTTTPAQLEDVPFLLVTGRTSNYGNEPVFVVPATAKIKSSTNPSGYDDPLASYLLADARIHDLALHGISPSAAVVIGSIVNTTFRDIDIADAGFGQAFAGIGQFTSYENVFHDISLYGSIAYFTLRHFSIATIQACTNLDNARVFFASNSLGNAKVADMMLSPDARNTKHLFYCVNGGWTLEDISSDNESFAAVRPQSTCESYFDARTGDQPVTLAISGFYGGTGSYRRPMIVLGGFTESEAATQGQSVAGFIWKDVLYVEPETAQPGFIRVDSPSWTPLEPIRQHTPLTRVPLVLDNTETGSSRIIVEVLNYSSPPRHNYWQKSKATLTVFEPVSGRPLEYTVWKTGGMGTATPAEWAPVRFLDNDPSRLAADLIGHCYWSDGSAAKSTIFGHWSDYVQGVNLDWIFHGVLHTNSTTAATLPAGIQAGLSNSCAFRGENYHEVASGVGYSRQALAGTDFVFPSPGRVELTKALTFGPATQDWDDGGWKSQTSAFLLLDTDAGNLLASLDFTPVSVKTGGSVALAANQVFMQHQPVSSSSFAPSVEDALAKAWLTGASLPTYNSADGTTSVLYLALSTGPADVGSAPTEPATGTGYARVAAPSSVWSTALTVQWPGKYAPNSSGLQSAEGDVIQNSSVLDFPGPTGDWGTVRSVYLMTAATGGSVVAAANLLLPRTITAGSKAPGFDMGGFRITRS